MTDDAIERASIRLKMTIAAAISDAEARGIERAAACVASYDAVNSSANFFAEQIRALADSAQPPPVRGDLAALRRVAEAARELLRLPRDISDAELGGETYAARYVRAEAKLKDALDAARRA